MHTNCMLHVCIVCVCVSLCVCTGQEGISQHIVLPAHHSRELTAPGHCTHTGTLLVHRLPWLTQVCFFLLCMCVTHARSCGTQHTHSHNLISLSSNVSYIMSIIQMTASLTHSLTHTHILLILTHSLYYCLMVVWDVIKVHEYVYIVIIIPIELIHTNTLES